MANTSPGSSSTGSRLIVASAAPVTMFVAPGPIEVVQASVPSRFALFAIARRRVHHRLLVARLVVGQRAPGSRRAPPDAGHVAVPEDPEAAAEEPVLDAVPLDVLRGEEADERLRCGEPHDEETSA